jgi:hypothetical protein
MSHLSVTDEVRTFPQLHMPVPLSLRDKGIMHLPKLHSKLDNVRFPKMLTSAKLSCANSSTQPYQCSKNIEFQTPAHFSNLKLESLSQAPSPVMASSASQSREPKRFSVINLGSTTESPFKSETLEVASNSTANEKKQPFQILIYRGTTLSCTVEFADFKKANHQHWRPITGVLRELEEHSRSHHIKLAVVDGARINEISSLHSVAGIFSEDLMSSITEFNSMLSPLLLNREEVRLQIKFLAASLIQRSFRNYLNRTCFLQQRLQGICAVLIQSAVRRFLACLCVRVKLKFDRALAKTTWIANVDKLKKSWQKLSSTDPLALSIALDRKWEKSIMNEISTRPTALSSTCDRLLIYIPSISCAEYMRLSMDRLQSIQNTHIACLYQLFDPQVHILYVSPVHLSKEEIRYHENFLSDSGIHVCTDGIRRLNFIVPEMIDRLPLHLSISQLLWCSSQALKKIRTFVKQIPNAVIVPTSLSWVEKRLSSYLNIPILAPDPAVANIITSRSFIKNIFLEACLSTPTGARDIYSSSDFYVTLSSLITSNIEVQRWVFKLNVALDNEGFAFLDVDKLSVTAALRADWASHLGGRDDRSLGWHSKQVQLELRKTVLLSLCAELPSKAVVCKRAMHASWEHFEKHFGVCGMVIDAGCVSSTEHLQGLCFIDPNGAVKPAPGVNVIVDKSYQVQGYIGPQTRVPMEVLDDATIAVAKLLYERWGVIGYVAVEFESHWSRDSSDLKAGGLKLGLSPAFLGSGSAATMGGALGPVMILPRSLIPSRESLISKSFVYIPFAHYEALGPCRGESFSKQCKSRRVGFDRDSRTGTLFFLVDASVGGSVSTLCIGSSPAKAIDIAIHTLHFVISQYGRLAVDERNSRSSDHLTSILSTLKAIKRKDNKKNQDLISS